MTNRSESRAKGPTRDLEGVEFLKHLHRHMFHIRAEIVVSKNDDSREIEIILAKRAIEKFIDDSYPDKNMGNTSCEVLASKIWNFLSAEYGTVEMGVTVLEDNENGSTYSNIGA
ncbi:MAG TPA: hypothetical protein EYQ46_17960 [Myxococcales bacterium]|nr:hypothetical protein [Myxococcales bacterium]